MVDVPTKGTARERWDFKRWGALPVVTQGEILAVLVDRLGGDVTITDAELMAVQGDVSRWTDPVERVVRFQTSKKQRHG